MRSKTLRICLKVTELINHSAIKWNTQASRYGDIYRRVVFKINTERVSPLATFFHQLLFGELGRKEYYYGFKKYEEFATKMNVRLFLFSSKPSLRFPKLIPIWSMDTHMLKNL